MCNAHNHSNNCTCGFGDEGHSAGYWPRNIPCYTSDIRSFTIPNALCPVCHEPVFYYCNEDGASVFFEQLGHPWPKHPCTDMNSVPIVTTPSTNLRAIDKRDKSSTPIFINYIKSIHRNVYQVEAVDVTEKRDIRFFLVSHSKPNIPCNFFSELRIRRSEEAVFYIDHFGNSRTIRAFRKQYEASDYAILFSSFHQKRRNRRK